MQDGPKIDQNGGRVFRIIVKRQDTGGDAGFASTMEAVRIRMVDIFAAKGDGSHVPAWLSSADSLRDHFQSVLGSAFEFDVGSQSGSGGPVALTVFEGGGSESLLDLSSVPLRFVPEFLDVPSQFG